MSAWAEAVWITKKIKNNFEINTQSLNTIKGNYDNLANRVVTKAKSIEQPFPTDNIGIGTVCFIYDDSSQEEG